jgi:hypothetical protein
MKVRFFWGTAQQFTGALRDRWDAKYAAGAAPPAGGP